MLEIIKIRRDINWLIEQIKCLMKKCENCNNSGTGPGDALVPGDNVSELLNDAGYLTELAPPQDLQSVAETGNTSTVPLRLINEDEELQYIYTVLPSSFFENLLETRYNNLVLDATTLIFYAIKMDEKRFTSQSFKFFFNTVNLKTQESFLDLANNLILSILTPLQFLRFKTCLIFIEQFITQEQLTILEKKLSERLNTQSNPAMIQALEKLEKVLHDHEFLIKIISTLKANLIIKYQRLNIKY